METCVLQQSLQVTTASNEQDTELGSKGLTIQHQGNASTTDSETSTAIINNRKISSASLSDLIPAAAAALRTRQQLQRNSQQTGVSNKSSPSHSTKPATEDSTLYYHQQQQQNSTPFARALTKVKLQVQTKRLKERYLSHEWIRLALGLPVDLSRINLHHCYYSREQADTVGKPQKTTQTTTEKAVAAADTMITPTPTLSSTSSPPSPAPSNTTSTTRSSKNLSLDPTDNNQLDQLTERRKSIPVSMTTPPASPSSSRTGEIATWYEWKFDRSKFSVEEVQCKVDRLRNTKIRDKLLALSP